MVRNKLLLLLVFCLVVITQSCVHGDLDDCPPMVNYAVAFQFTHHMYSGDRVHDDVKKIDLFVFDEQNLVYKTTTQRGPNDTNFLIPLTDLPMGKYHIIAWGNVMDNGHVKITPENFEKGVTTLQEARLTLQRLADNISHEDLDKIFYGDTIVEVPLYVSRVDTIPLINNTNNIRVVLHWDHTDASPQQLGQIVEFNDVFVTLQGTNAEFYFDDKPTATNIVQYSPYTIDKTGAILSINTWDHMVRYYHYPDTIDARMDSCVYDFKVLRLLPGNPLKLNIIQESTVAFENLLAPIGSADRFDRTFGEDIVGTNTDNNGFSYVFRNNFSIPATVQAIQSSFDRYENYRIDITLKYSRLANTYFTVMDIKVQDWHNVIIDVPGWAD